MLHNRKSSHGICELFLASMRTGTVLDLMPDGTGSVVTTVLRGPESNRTSYCLDAQTFSSIPVPVFSNIYKKKSSTVLYVELLH